jgi:protoheme IX farnesyltransferase
MEVSVKMNGGGNGELKQMLRDYFDLTKPGIGFYSLITTFASFWLASHHDVNYILLLHTLLGTALVTAGGGALNQVIEIKLDAEMRRTEKRPLPAGRISARAGLIFGVITSIIGSLYLLLFVNGLSSLLAVATLVGYLFIYTPMKRTTSLATVVGAFPGAVPILIGWAAVTGSIDIRGWTLFAILFLWQIPHFLAIAWMYRKDYERAGLPMLTVIDSDGISAAHQSVVYLIALLPISLLPTKFFLTGKFYFIGALILGIYYLVAAVQVIFKRTNASAKNLLIASILYLPVLLGLMIFDTL